MYKYEPNLLISMIIATNIECNSRQVLIVIVLKRNIKIMSICVSYPKHDVTKTIMLLPTDIFRCS